jgi:pimeloyl-ACP methyl ester carboxylesterase
VPYQNGIYYETHGSGIPLFLAPYFVACDSPYLSGYLDRLTERYRVLVIDPPGQGKSDPMPPSEFTAAQVCNVMLSVADAAGFDKFAWSGYSWGAVVGLQLAWRSDRLLALVCGGWPPLGGEYEKLLRAARTLLANPPSEGPYADFDAAPFVTFYESLQNWPEADAVRQILCPRLTLFGSEDATAIGDGTAEIATAIRGRRGELERLGWKVVEIPGRNHSLFVEPELVVPIIREMLDTLAQA